MAVSGSRNSRSADGRRPYRLIIRLVRSISRRYCKMPRLAPLRSAEPQPQRDTPALTSAEDTEEMAQRIRDLAARHREFARKLAGSQSVMVPAEDPDFETQGPAFPTWADPGRDAILQPPKPQIQPSEQILDLVAARDLDMEAAD
jgi:hypothetical protein